MDDYIHSVCRCSEAPRAAAAIALGYRLEPLPPPSGFGASDPAHSPVSAPGPRPPLRPISCSPVPCSPLRAPGLPFPFPDTVSGLRLLFPAAIPWLRSHPRLPLWALGSYPPAPIRPVSDPGPWLLSPFSRFLSYSSASCLGSVPAHSLALLLRSRPRTLGHPFLGSRFGFLTSTFALTLTFGPVSRPILRPFVPSSSFH